MIAIGTGAEGRPGTPMDLATRILVVDDDAEIRMLLSEFLERHGYSVTTAADGAEMDRLLFQGSYDLAVLDVMMPGEDGLSILRRIQSQAQGPNGMPIIMLSAVGTDIDRIVGLEMGAEDYLPKPCNPRELLARIRTVLRRVRQSTPSEARPDTRPDSGDVERTHRFAGWSLSLPMRVLLDPDSVIVTLTDGEFRLLRAFIEHPRRVLSRDQLLEYSAGQDSESYDRAIDVQVSRLRRKLESGRDSDLIRTVRNEGYMFTAAVETRKH